MKQKSVLLRYDTIYYYDMNPRKLQDLCSILPQETPLPCGRFLPLSEDAPISADLIDEPAENG